MADDLVAKARTGRTDLHALVQALVQRRAKAHADSPAAIAASVTEAAELLAIASGAGRPTLALLEALLANLQGAFGCRRVRLVLRSEVGDGFVTYASGGQAGVRIEHARAVAGLTAAALAAARPISYPVPTAEPGYDPAADGTGEQLAGCGLLLVPVGDPAAGVLQLAIAEPGPLTAGDEELLQDVGRWLLRAVSDFVGPLDTLPPPSLSRRQMRLQTVLGQVLELAVDMLDADCGIVLMHDAESRQLLLSAGRGADLGIRLDASAGIPGWVLRTGESVCLADAYRDLRFHPGFDLHMRYMTRSVLCVPIPGADMARIGVLQVMNKRSGEFDAGDLRRLRLLAQQIGVAYEQGTRLVEAVRLQAHNEFILQNLSGGIILVDSHGMVTYANDAARRITGLSIAAAGKPVAELFTDFNIWVFEAIEEVTEPGMVKRFENTELYLEDRDDWVSVNMSILALSSAQGVLLGRAIMIDDLSREKALRQTISRYLPNTLIDSLVNNVDAAKTGISQDVTVLFCDIRKFTPLSEALGPSATVSMLNEYFSYMEDVVTNHNGVIDKYIGDALMSLFGAPLPTPNDPDNAVAAARDMCYALSLMNDRRIADGKQPLKIGIGIGTGRVISGNIGSPKRMDFTVIGDAVNRAARIEALTKTYGAMVLICGTTFERMRGRVLSRRVDVVRPRGQTVPTEIYEIASPRNDQSSNQILRGWHAYEEALAAYIAGNWAVARQGFEEAANHDPQDVAARLMATRCAEFVAGPPAEWDGVWTLPADS
jgi:adenylate cyclase